MIKQYVVDAFTDRTSLISYCYYSVPLSREVFFVSEAKRKSQKIRGLPARNYAECIIFVHREACYCSQPYGL